MEKKKENKQNTEKYIYLIEFPIAYGITSQYCFLKYWIWEKGRNFKEFLERGDGGSAERLLEPPPQTLPHREVELCREPPFEKVYIFHHREESYYGTTSTYSWQLTKERANERMKRAEGKEREFWEKFLAKFSPLAESKGKREAWQEDLDWRKLEEEYLREGILRNYFWLVLYCFKPSIQIDWLKSTEMGRRYSIEVIETGLEDLKDEKEVFKTYHKKLDELKKELLKSGGGEEDRWIVNFGPGTTEVRLSWFMLGVRRLFPIRCFLREERLRPQGTSSKKGEYFNYRAQYRPLFPQDYREIFWRPMPYSGVKSEEVDSVQRRLRQYLDPEVGRGFLVLVLGERGVGKTYNVEEAAREVIPRKNLKKDEKPYILINCAGVDKNLALTQIFGHKKGAFTSAERDKEGVLKFVDRKVVIFDEVHHLSEEVQAKLLHALQTDKEGYIHFHRLGEEEGKPEKVKLNYSVVFLSNLSLEELQKRLREDFFDRICQRIVEVPSLREVCRDAKDWERVWRDVQENLNIQDGGIPEFSRLRKSLGKVLFGNRRDFLPGNYRDLKFLAIQIYDYNRFPSEEKEYWKKKRGIKDCFDWVKHQLELLYQDASGSPSIESSLEKEVLDALRSYIRSAFREKSQRGLWQRLKKRVLGEIVPQERKEARLSQSEAGEILGFTKNMLSKWEVRAKEEKGQNGRSGA